VYLTEAARNAISLYLDSIFRMFSRSDYLFKSRKPNSKGEYVLTPESGHRIMKDAQRDLNLPINMGSHTMRKTFLTLAFHISLRAKNLSNISLAMGVSQMLARHANVQTTMTYMKENKKMLHAVRNKVSDFLMGKSDITVLDIDYTEMM
jgi:integrase